MHDAYPSRRAALAHFGVRTREGHHTLRAIPLPSEQVRAALRLGLDRERNGLLFPVASAWLAAWRRDPTIDLYSPDGLHPSMAGSYLAALVMYGVLYHRSPVGLPARVRLISSAAVGVSSAEAALLQEAAAEVLPP